MEPTKVIFRKWPASEGGDVIALFPLHPATNDGWLCDSYEHIGQHGGADPLIVTRTTLARPKEYASLKAELRKIGYSPLQVLSRFPRNAFDKRKAALPR